MATISGTFTEAGQASESFFPDAAIRRGRFNVSVSGSFEADIALQRSFDGGTTWIPVAGVDFSPVTFDGPLSLASEETESSVAWRLYCTSLSSGEVAYRMSR